MGEPVAAIGSPFGERQSLSVGVISALDRTIQSLTQFQIGDAIQTDAAINPGNSGGPLLDARGPRDRASTRRSSPSRAAARAWASRSRSTRCAARCASCATRAAWSYGYLGVDAQPLYPQLAARLDLAVETGALVQDVVDGSPADDAGLEAGDDEISFQGQTDIAAGGDVIVGVDGEELTREHDLADVISAHSAGERVRARRWCATASGAPSTSSSAAPAGAAGAASACASSSATWRSPCASGCSRSLGSHAARAHEAAGRRRRRDLRDRRGGRARARGASWPSARPTWRSTPRTAGSWSPAAAARARCSWWTRSTAPGPALAGLESCCVSVAAAPLDGEPTMGDVTVGCVVEIPSGQVFLAERGAGWSRARRCSCRANERIERMFWTYGFRGRPARALTEVLGELIDASSVGGATFELGSAAFDMTRVVTGQLDAYVEPGPRMVDDVPGMRGEFERVGGGAVLNNSPYDLAAAALILEEAGAVVTDALRRARSAPGRCSARCTSSRCRWWPAANPALHAAILRALDAGFQRVSG